jgi:ABC-type glutathione transport system ATPase component
MTAPLPRADATPQVPQGEAVPGAPLIDVQQVTRRYPLARQGLWEPRRMLTALDKVSLTVHKGRTLGVVGESGSGKSTLTRCLLGLEPVDGGRILYRGADIAVHGAPGRRAHAARVQVVFQDPNASMNPRMTVHDIVAEGMVIHERELGLDGPARTAQVLTLLQHVGLGRDHLHRYPHELSGGQRQRVCIARALALKPECLILDEPTSALDVSVQAQVLNLLHEMQQTFGLTYLFVSHDLAVVRYLCDDVVVLRGGKVVEAAPTEQLFSEPQDDYTRALIAAIPEVAF